MAKKCIKPFKVQCTSVYCYVQVCPGLYRAEDALSSKVHELLLAAGQTGKVAERSRLVEEAVKISKQIAGNLRLDVSNSYT